MGGIFMIYKEVITDPFMKYQLMTEADGETPSSRNRKTITLKTKDRRKEVFTRRAEKMLGDDNPESEQTGEDSEETPNDPITDGGMTLDPPEDMGDVDTPITDDPKGEEGTEDDENEPVTDDTSFSDMAEDTEGSSEAGDTGGGEAEDTPDEPVTDDTSFSDMANDTEGEDATGNTSTGDEENASSSNDSVEERTRKYKLYQKFQKLNKVLESQSDIVNNLVSEDTAVNQKYKTIAKKIKDLNQLLSEYQMLRFEQEPYINSMLFYQRVLAATDITLSALKDILKEIKRNAVKTDKH